jgi:hypothetical protein
VTCVSATCKAVAQVLAHIAMTKQLILKTCNYNMISIYKKTTTRSMLRESTYTCVSRVCVCARACASTPYIDTAQGILPALRLGVECACQRSARRPMCMHMSSQASYLHARVVSASQVSYMCVCIDEGVLLACMHRRGRSCVCMHR